ncbi:MAG: hypothetical protein Q9157_004202 [Trypethelium eluteriae]
MNDERAHIEFSGSENQGLQVGCNATGGTIETHYHYATGKSASSSTQEALANIHRFPRTARGATESVVKKSQLAIEYAYQLREQYPGVWAFWVHASNADRFEQGYWNIAAKAKIFGHRDPKANIFKLVHDWLYDDKRKWVLILDNVDDADFLFDKPLVVQSQPNSGSSASQPLRDYVPHSQNGSVLITSRSREAAR